MVKRKTDNLASQGAFLLLSVFYFGSFEHFPFKISYFLLLRITFTQLVKNLPAMQETPVQFLGQEDPLEKG